MNGNNSIRHSPSWIRVFFPTLEIDFPYLLQVWQIFNLFCVILIKLKKFRISSQSRHTIFSMRLTLAVVCVSYRQDLFQISALLLLFGVENLFTLQSSLQCQFQNEVILYASLTGREAWRTYTRHGVVTMILKFVPELAMRLIFCRKRRIFILDVVPAFLNLSLFVLTVTNALHTASTCRLLVIHTRVPWVICKFVNCAFCGSVVSLSCDPCWADPYGVLDVALSHLIGTSDVILVIHLSSLLTCRFTTFADVRRIW